MGVEEEEGNRTSNSTINYGIEDRHLPSSTQLRAHTIVGKDVLCVVIENDLKRFQNVGDGPVMGKQLRGNIRKVVSPIVPVVASVLVDSQPLVLLIL